MLIPPDLEKALILIEGLINEVSEALITGDSQALVMASSNLRQGAVDFSQKLSKFGLPTLQNPSVMLRLKKISINLALRRESLIRQSGVVERSLLTLVPASQTTTYGKVAGPYGAPSKSSGTFKYLAS